MVFVVVVVCALWIDSLCETALSEMWKTLIFVVISTLLIFNEFRNVLPPSGAIQLCLKDG